MKRKHNPWASLVALMMLIVILMLTCTGCGQTKTEYADADNAPKVMTIVDSTNGYTIYKHDETGVHYFCRDGGYGRSAVVMVNPDGTPYIG